jgi:pimeloyl-ACP methyl ester carboxylesterase
MIETHTIEARGFSYTTDVCGPEGGVPIIFLHGFPNSRFSWHDSLKAAAAAGYRGYAPDQRGYSKDARPDGVATYHVDEIVKDVGAIADAVGAEKFHLIGHDWGGQIAWLSAIAMPERLLSLSVLSRPHPAAFAKAIKQDEAQANRSRHHKAFQDPTMADRLLEDDAKAIYNTLVYENAAGLFGKTGAGPFTRRMSDQKAGEHLSVIGDRDALDAALNWYRAAFSGQSTLAREDAPKITVPTLYIWGNEDMSVGRIAANCTEAEIASDYTFVELNGVGHFSAEECPEEVNAALLAHFAKHSPAP